MPCLIYSLVLSLFMRSYVVAFCPNWSLQRSSGLVNRYTVWLSSKWKKIRMCINEAGAISCQEEMESSVQAEIAKCFTCWHCRGKIASARLWGTAKLQTNFSSSCQQNFHLLWIHFYTGILCHGLIFFSLFTSVLKLYVGKKRNSCMSPAHLCRLNLISSCRIWMQCLLRLARK